MHKMVKFPLGGIMLLRESLEEIDDFRVKRCRKFEFGPPSADTILRVFRNVNADKIEKVFIKWAHGIYGKVKNWTGQNNCCHRRKDDVRLKQGHGSKLKTGNITSARTCRGWRIKMNGQDLRLLPWHGKNGL